MDIDRQSLTANQQAAKQAGHGQGTTCFVMKIFFGISKLRKSKTYPKTYRFRCYMRHLTVQTQTSNHLRVHAKQG